MPEKFSTLPEKVRGVNGAGEGVRGESLPQTTHVLHDLCPCHTMSDNMPENTHAHLHLHTLSYTCTLSNG